MKVTRSTEWSYARLLYFVFRCARFGCFSFVVQCCCGAGKQEWVNHMHRVCENTKNTKLCEIRKRGRQRKRSVFVLVDALSDGRWLAGYCTARLILFPVGFLRAASTHGWEVVTTTIHFVLAVFGLVNFLCWIFYRWKILGWHVPPSGIVTWYATIRKKASLRVGKKKYISCR